MQQVLEMQVSVETRPEHWVRRATIEAYNEWRQSTHLLKRSLFLDGRPSDIVSCQSYLHSATIFLQICLLTRTKQSWSFSPSAHIAL
jgi:hypothetical protein